MAFIKPFTDTRRYDWDVCRNGSSNNNNCLCSLLLTGFVHQCLTLARLERTRFLRASRLSANPTQRDVTFAGFAIVLVERAPKSCIINPTPLFLWCYHRQKPRLPCLDLKGVNLQHGRQEVKVWKNTSFYYYMILYVIQYY